MEFTFESFKKMNDLYDHEHGITESDYQNALEMKAFIETIVSEGHLISRCDVVEYTDEHGDYYPNARVDELSYWNGPDKITVCERPYIPFVSLSADKAVLFGSMSGGAFVGVDKSAFERVGTTEALFKAWGHCGACGNGAFVFPATVNKWRANLRKGEFGKYSSKDYRRLEVRDNRNSYGEPLNGSMYRFLGDGIAWRDEAELNRYLKQYKAVLDTEAKSWNGSKVYWAYKSVELFYYEQETFDKIPAAPFYKYWNGSDREQKITVNDEIKTVFTHINRSNEDFSWRK